MSWLRTIPGRAGWYIFTAFASVSALMVLEAYMPAVGHSGGLMMSASALNIALFVAIIALIRFLSDKRISVLFIGMGFLATAVLEGLALFSEASHGAVPPQILGRFAGNNFLAGMIFMSWIATRWGGGARYARKRTVYLAVGALTTAIFIAAVTLPNSKFAMNFLHGPADWAPCILLSVALIGYLRQGRWKTRTFEHFLVIAIVVFLSGNLSHLVLCSAGADTRTDVGHLVNISGYMIVLAGVLISTHRLFRSAVRDGARLRAIVDTALDGIITADETGRILDVNEAAERIFGYRSGTLPGWNISDLVADSERDAHLRGFDKFLRTGSSSIIGTHVEVSGQRRNGTTILLDLAISELRIGEDRFFVAVFRDITERKKIDEMKNEFVSVVSHELRTPLTSMLGSLGLILGGTLGKLPNSISAMVEIAHNNGQRLVRLINDILDVQKIESGVVTFRAAPIDANALLVRSVLDNEAYGRELGVMFDLRSDISSGWVLGDQDRLIQVLTNLLSNAAKYSPQGEQVTVALSRNGGRLRFEITDRGQGISPEDRRRIFEKFAQVDSSDTRQKQGTGLGLTIAKAIVLRHDGLIDVETGPGGTGTTFYFEIPEIAAPGATDSQNTENAMAAQS